MVMVAQVYLPNHYPGISDLNRVLSHNKEKSSTALHVVNWKSCSSNQLECLGRGTAAVITKSHVLNVYIWEFKEEHMKSKLYGR
jgi:hypothetical protein